jgi:hypothetical protein
VISHGAQVARMEIKLSGGLTSDSPCVCKPLEVIVKVAVSPLKSGS